MVKDSTICVITVTVLVVLVNMRKPTNDDENFMHDRHLGIEFNFINQNCYKFPHYASTVAPRAMLVDVGCNLVKNDTLTHTFIYTTGSKLVATTITKRQQ